MSRQTLAVLTIATILAAAGAGCQCTCLEDFSGDIVDHVNQMEPSLDSLYHPEFVPRRIGDPEWCRCPLNRFFCRRQCGYVNTRGEFVPYAFPDD